MLTPLGPLFTSPLSFIQSEHGTVQELFNFNFGKWLLPIIDLHSFFKSQVVVISVCEKVEARVGKTLLSLVGT